MTNSRLPFEVPTLIMDHTQPIHLLNPTLTLSELKCLLEQKANPNIADKKNVTPLMSFAAHNKVIYPYSNVLMMLAYGAKLDYHDHQDKTAYDYAKSAKNFDLALVLRYLEHHPQVISLEEIKKNDIDDEDFEALFDKLTKKARNSPECHDLVEEAKIELRIGILRLAKHEGPSLELHAFKEKLSSLYKTLFDDAMSPEAIEFRDAVLRNEVERRSDTIISHAEKKENSNVAVRFFQLQAENNHLKQQLQAVSANYQKLEQNKDLELNELKSQITLLEEKITNDKKNHENEKYTYQDTIKELNSGTDKQLSRLHSIINEQKSTIDNMQMELSHLKSNLSFFQKDKTHIQEQKPLVMMDDFEILIKIIKDKSYWQSKSKWSFKCPDGIQEMQKIVGHFENILNKHELYTLLRKIAKQRQKPSCSGNILFFLFHYKCRDSMTENLYQLLQNVALVEDLDKTQVLFKSLEQNWLSQLHLRPIVSEKK